MTLQSLVDSVPVVVEKTCKNHRFGAFFGLFGCLWQKYANSGTLSGHSARCSSQSICTNLGAFVNYLV